MGKVERIEVRKIYVGSAANFGLVFGLITSLIVGLLVFIIGLTGVNLYDSILPFEGNNVLFSGLVFIAIFFKIFIGAIIFALLFNLAAKIGGRVSLGLIEYEVPIRKNKKVKNAAPAQAPQSSLSPPPY